MADERYRFRGEVIQCWERDRGGMWQAHRCHWSVDIWPFSERELNRLTLIRWLVTEKRIDEWTAMVDQDQAPWLAAERLRSHGSHFAGRIGDGR